MEPVTDQKLEKLDDRVSREPRNLPAVSDALSSYLARVEKIPLLSREEEHKLAVRYQKYGDIAAAHSLVTSNLRFVIKIALEYRRYRARLLDLIQEGNIGLMLAVKKFDPSKGYRLISYAVWWIRAYIQAFIMRTWSMVKFGTTRAQRKLFYSLSSLQSTFDQETPDRIAEKLNVSEKDVIEAEMRMSHADFSLDSRLNDETGTTHLDLLADHSPSQEDILADREEKTLVHSGLQRALQQLHPREAYVLQHRLLSDHPLTLEEIGEKFNVTRERVRQIEERALKKVKQTLLLPSH